MSHSGKQGAIFTRRSFLSITAASATGTLIGCSLPGISDPTMSGSARLSARPQTPTATGPLGLRRLGLGSTADGSVYVPDSYKATAPAPLVLLLHGAGGSGASFIGRYVPEADQTGQILLAVDSRKVSWDFVDGGFGPDIEFLDAAFRDTFSRYAVHAGRIAVAGFSDGATMALALGLCNGDLFPRVVAWSPGFLIGTKRVGRPAFSITHGTNDQILPIESSSRVIARDLRKDGYQVELHEFDGGHIVPADLLHDTMAWMASPARTAARSG